MEDVELDLRNTGVKRRRTRGVGRIKWTLLWGKPRPNLHPCSATEEEDIKCACPVLLTGEVEVPELFK